MQAVVLVGGFGTRLRPLTLTTPKNLLPVVHVPMVERLVSHLADHGVTRAVLALGYKPDAFLDAYPDGEIAGVELAYAVEDEPLDTAGAIRFAAVEAGIDDRFLVVNGDILTDLDVTRMVRFHEASDARATVALHAVENPSRYGVVVTDVAGRVEAFVEKPSAEDAPSNRINAGTYVFERSVLDAIDSGRRVSVERETFPALAATGALYALESDSYWLDVGTPSAYLQANLDLVSDDGSAVHESVQVGDAEVTRSVVGADACIADGAQVIESVVLPGAAVAADARISGSIVGPGAVIGAGATLDELTVIGASAHVDANVALVGARVPDSPG